MKSLVIVLISVIFFQACDRLVGAENETNTETDELYFPPLTGDEWETTSIDSLGWNKAAVSELLSLLEDGDTRAFILLKDGRIVIEEYWGKDLMGIEFDKNSTWYWASAGKTLTSFLIGIAQDEGKLDINDSSSEYLGDGWTSLDPTQEEKIKILHQLTMTTGLDESPNRDCTDPACFKFKEEPGSRWYYHNAPYTKLDGVIEAATGETFDMYFDSKLRDPIGMKGFWSYLDYNHIYFSNARSMARFGLMVSNNGSWGANPILADEEFLAQSTSSSQELNPSYGYLWWLNGKEKIVFPGLAMPFNLNLTENAPKDMFAAMGKNGQLINIVPSENIIMVRMGDNPDKSLVPTKFQNDIWEKLLKLIQE